MALNFQILLLALVMLPVLTGCTPEPNRESTELKSAADVKITLREETQAESVSNDTTNIDEGSDNSSDDSSVSSSTSNDNSNMTSDNEVKPDSGNSSQPSAGYSGPAKFFGRVTVSGDAPSYPPLLAKGGTTKDPICAEEAVPNQSVIVSNGGGLANVFVYMKKAPKKDVPDPTNDSPLIDQKGCVFLPHAAIVRVGQSVTLKNSDPVAHNVNVKAFQDPYNSVVPANGSIEHTFRFPENLPASTGCDFHTFMNAWVLPVTHPWATITDKDGRFEIPDLPEGEWNFIVWHEAAGYVERSVKVKATPNNAIEMNFEVPASKFSQ